MITYLGQEFEEVQFKGELSYIIINYKEPACYVLAHKITNEEFKLIRDILIDLEWLYLLGKAQAS